MNKKVLIISLIVLIIVITISVLIIKSQSTEEPIWTVGNNGSVSCDKYCQGINGAPWNNELPVDWNGANCSEAKDAVTNQTVSCSATHGKHVKCLCKKSDIGWS
jgi:hypothetical protein